MNFKTNAAPTITRLAMWNHAFGKYMRNGKCTICKGIIYVETFNCGNYIPKKIGEMVDFKNLRPLCVLCHKALGNRGISEIDVNTIQPLNIFQTINRNKSIERMQISTKPTFSFEKKQDTYNIFDSNASNNVSNNMFQFGQNFNQSGSGFPNNLNYGFNSNIAFNNNNGCDAMDTDEEYTDTLMIGLKNNINPFQFSAFGQTKFHF